MTQKGLQDLSFRYCEADLGPFIVSFNPDCKGTVNKWPFLEDTCFAILRELQLKFICKKWVSLSPAVTKHQE